MTIAPHRGAAPHFSGSTDFSVFEDLESEVRLYCRKFPTVFHIVELCGRHDEVVKVLPPLNIDIVWLDRGLDVLRNGLLAV